MRYLYNEDYFQPDGGCILFYAGNESPVTNYWVSSGFVVQELAPILGGYILFAEHRYYGESMPFGDDSFN